MMRIRLHMGVTNYLGFVDVVTACIWFEVGGIIDNQAKKRWRVKRRHWCHYWKGRDFLFHKIPKLSPSKRTAESAMHLKILPCFTAGKIHEVWNCHTAWRHRKSIICIYIRYGWNRDNGVERTVLEQHDVNPRKYPQWMWWYFTPLWYIIGDKEKTSVAKLRLTMTPLLRRTTFDGNQLHQGSYVC
jgi:hypothetical protein